MRAYWPFVALALNAFLVLNVIDIVYRPLFYDSNDLSMSRVGFVSHENAQILVREPDSSKLPLSLSYREHEGIRAWKSAISGRIPSQAQVFAINDMESSTYYDYVTSNNHTGSFRTAPTVGSPHTNESKFTLVTSSCVKTRFPYNPFAHPREISGLQRLAEWIPKLRAQFMLFLGDFIYVDVPLRHGSDVGTYRHEYRQVYSSPDWQKAWQTLPWIHVIDDHEIANDWDRGLDAPYPAAIDPWDIYHASVNPPSVRPNASYYQFSQGPASFFMLDTRRFRSLERIDSATSPNKTMLGQEQLSSLLGFLNKSEPRGMKWKFVVSSIPFTRNWRINSADAWAGYLRERRVVLEAMWDVGLRDDGIGVIVLSGDRHEVAAMAFPPPKGGKWPQKSTVHEFSTSPLSMFYLPFRSYWEVDGEEEEEICIKYVPDRNSKFGAIELEQTGESGQGSLRFRLFVDGKESWRHVLVTSPVHKPEDTTAKDVS